MATTTMASAAPTPLWPALTSSQRWTSYSALVLAVCILAGRSTFTKPPSCSWCTSILIKEWGITPATMGTVTRPSRWIGLIGTFLFPVSLIFMAAAGADLVDSGLCGLPASPAS